MRNRDHQHGIIAYERKKVGQKNLTFHCLRLEPVAVVLWQMHFELKGPLFTLGVGIFCRCHLKKKRDLCHIFALEMLIHKLVSRWRDMPKIIYILVICNSPIPFEYQYTIKNEA